MAEQWEPTLESEEEKNEEIEQSAPGVSEAPSTQEDASASVDIITGEKKMTMSAPVKEFEEFKISFKAMMVAFGNFIEAAGLEIGRNETDEKVEALTAEMEKLRDEIAEEQQKIQDQLVTKDEFIGFKNDSEVMAEDYVRRSEFDRFREAIKEVL